MNSAVQHLRRIKNLPEEVGEEEEELLLGEGLTDAEPAPHHEWNATLVSPVQLKLKAE